MSLIAEDLRSAAHAASECVTKADTADPPNWSPPRPPVPSGRENQDLHVERTVISPPQPPAIPENGRIAAGIVSARPAISVIITVHEVADYLARHEVTDYLDRCLDPIPGLEGTRPAGGPP